MSKVKITRVFELTLSYEEARLTYEVLEKYIETYPTNRFMLGDLISQLKVLL